MTTETYITNKEGDNILITNTPEGLIALNITQVNKIKEAWSKNPLYKPPKCLPPDNSLAKFDTYPETDEQDY